MPNKPQNSSKNSSPLMSQPGIDASIIKKLEKLYVKLSQVVSSNSDRQEFGPIWMIRSEIKDLEFKASLQARYYASRAKQRENEEREIRAKAGSQASDELKTKQVQKTQHKARNQLEIDAKALIKQEALFLCRKCDGGFVKVECTMCNGSGLGELRQIIESVPTVCSNRHPSCRLCGGTGVFGAVRKKMVDECENCNGTGEAKIKCHSCRGGQILNGRYLAAKLPRELNKLILKLLK